MTRSSFTLAELKAREAEHRTNSIQGIYIPRWNRNEALLKAEEEVYKTTQLNLANVFAELIFYREKDIIYYEVEVK
ncbi:MAG TPA: hypothetical protein VGF75_08230 [Candidatus Saccharimonadales bacterium]